MALAEQEEADEARGEARPDIGRKDDLHMLVSLAGRGRVSGSQHLFQAINLDPWDDQLSVAPARAKAPFLPLD
jgi:hypothetical protein